MAMKVVLQLPPRLSSRMRVSLESLQLQRRRGPGDGRQHHRMASNVRRPQHRRPLLRMATSHHRLSCTTPSPTPPAAPVGHVRPAVAPLWVGQRGDDVAQGGQALIDLLALLQALARGARHVHALATRQVHEVELANLQKAGAVKNSRFGNWRQFAPIGRCVGDGWAHRQQRCAQPLQQAVGTGCCIPAGPAACP